MSSLGQPVAPVPTRSHHVVLRFRRLPVAVGDVGRATVAHCPPTVRPPPCAVRPQPLYRYRDRADRGNPDAVPVTRNRRLLPQRSGHPHPGPPPTATQFGRGGPLAPSRRESRSVWS